MEQKRECQKCKEIKPLSEFSKNKRRASGFSEKCKVCHANYQAEWYQKNKEKHKKSTRIASKRLYQRNFDWIYEYLLSHPCVDCGETDPIVLDFDHVRGVKEFAVSKSVNGFSLKRIQEEVSKCDVRCANCHRRITSQRQGSRKEILGRKH